MIYLGDGAQNKMKFLITSIIIIINLRMENSFNTLTSNIYLNVSNDCRQRGEVTLFMNKFSIRNNGDSKYSCILF